MHKRHRLDATRAKREADGEPYRDCSSGHGKPRLQRGVSSETIDFRMTQAAADAESQSEFICREPSDYSARQFRQPLRNLDQEDIANLITIARIDFMEASDVDLYDNDVGGR